RRTRTARRADAPRGRRHRRLRGDRDARAHAGPHLVVARGGWRRDPGRRRLAPQPAVAEQRSSRTDAAVHARPAGEPTLDPEGRRASATARLLRAWATARGRGAVRAVGGGVVAASPVSAA